MAISHNRTSEHSCLFQRGLRIDEFCKLYRVGKTTAFRLMQEGTLTRIKIGRSTRLDAEDAEQWFKSCAQVTK